MLEKLKRLRPFLVLFLERLCARAAEFTMWIAISATVLIFIKKQSNDWMLIVYYLAACAVAEICGIIVRTNK